MRLHSNPASPFGRKVKVLAIETGVFDQLEVHQVQTTPVGPDPSLVADNPLARTELLGKAERFQPAQPPHFEHDEFIRLAIGMRREIDDTVVARVPEQLAVEPGPSLSLDLTLDVPADFEIGAWAELPRDEVAGAIAHATADIVARDHQVLAVVGPAAQDDVDMRIVSVPMIDRDPV